MPVRKFRPHNPTRRYMTVVYGETSLGTTNSPEKSLCKGKRRISGRAKSGRITMRRRGGAHSRRYRLIDFGRRKVDIPAKVASVEYDPNRSAHIALLNYKDGEKRYIIAPKDITQGDFVQSGASSAIRTGNTLPLGKIPLGTEVHNIELHVKKRGQFVRAAGTFATVLAKNQEYVLLRLPSGEQRNVSQHCFATIGRVSNSDHEKRVIGKAGRSRWLGHRPHVRGTAMNPVDHPHGGGEGKTKGGRHPVSPWGKPTKGYRTRRPFKFSDRYIVARRHKRRRS